MKISVILPNHNEARVGETVNQLYKWFPDFQVIVSDDKQGKGKGWAIRQGLKKATGDLIIFLDADGDIHPLEISRLLVYKDDYDVVVGMKDFQTLTLSRKVMSLGYGFIITCLFGIFCDTQTGLKLYHRYALSDFKSDGWGFDIELLMNAKKRGFKIAQVPVQVAISKQKGLKDVWKMLVETISLWFRLLFLVKR